MADNSNDRKKALYISMLLFLLGGGGIFLFFIIQGSNDLTGAKGKGNFTYGEAAREGVTSFFKTIGVLPDEEKPLTLAGSIRLEAKGIILGEPRPPSADVSDWMAPAGGKSGPARGNTVVPKMGGRGTSGVGGIGGGGSKSSGGASRFGEGSEGSGTKITGAAGSGSAAGKGTLGALTNARAALGEGLRSGSAMTAKSSWDRSFGVGNSSSKAGPNMAYAKTGLVNLDTIKKGEVDNLKTTDIKSLKTPEPGAFKEDKDAESKDSVLQKAKTDAAEAAAKAAKEAIAKQMAAGIGDGVGGTAGAPRPAAGAGGPGDSNDRLTLPPDVMEGVNSSFCKSDCVTDKGVVSDTKAEVTRTGDGYNITFRGTVTPPGGEPIPNEEVWAMDANGNLLKQVR